MTEKLSLNIISKSNDKFKNLKTATISLNVDGEMKQFDIDVYKIFSPVGIKECLVEYFFNLDKIRKKTNNEIGDISEPYLMWLLIKHFTVLGEEMPNKFEEQLESLKEMINSSALVQIMVHFDDSQIRILKEELEIILINAENNEGYLQELKEEYKEKIVDKDLLM